MARGKKQDDEQKRRDEKLARVSRKALGTDNSYRAVELVNQIAGTMASLSHSGCDEVAGVASLFSSLGDLAPQDEAERMLVAQMMAVHEAAMDCFRRAMIEGQGVEARDMNLKHAEKLVGMYARQLDALDKHRGKGKQKITVEHVNVHAGGQAIVGDVNATRAGAPNSAGQSQQAPSLVDDSATSDDGEELREELSAKETPATRRTKK